MSRNTQVSIHLDAIKSNFNVAQNLAPQSKNIAVIKANAYGHGMLKVAQTLEDIVPAFAVAIFDEAVTLREAGIQKPILILQGVHSCEELEYAIQHNFWLMVHNQSQLEILLKYPIVGDLKIWLKLDSGMHRLGFDSVQFQFAFSQLSYKNPKTIQQNLVLCSHFCAASNSETDSVDSQLKLFNQTISNLDNHSKFEKSLANSAAIMGFESSHVEWNRPGIMLYGVSPFDHPHSKDNLLKPTMTFTSEVIGLRKVAAGEGVGYNHQWIAEKAETIATVSVGYADGYPFAAKSGTAVIVAGQKAELVGRVSMDMISINVSKCNHVNIGDKVELWGQNLAAATIAKSANTIGYELFTGVSARVPRIYK